MSVKIWNPGTTEYESFGGGETLGDLPTVTPKYVFAEDVSEALGKFDYEAAQLLKANDSGVVHDTGNETGIAGNKEWTGDHTWEYGADGKVQIKANPADDSPSIMLWRSGDTIARIGFAAPTGIAGFPLLSFSNGSVGGATVYDDGTYLTVGTRPLAVTSVNSTGKTGATATPLITAGGTTSGAPTSGAHLKGEVICDDLGTWWRCTVAGTPGTWVNSAVEAIAKVTRPKVVNQFYFPATGTKSTTTMNLSRLNYIPYFLPAGTLDRLGIECTTGVATAVARLGVYADNGTGMPGALIAEASGTADLSTIGYKTLTISAVLPASGRYWLAAVTQTAAGTIRTAAQPDNMAWIQVGTSLPTAGPASHGSVFEASVTGALPSTASASGGYGNAVFPEYHMRYSA